MSVASSARYGTDLEATRQRLEQASVEGGFGISAVEASPGRVTLELPVTPSLFGPGSPRDALPVALAVLCDGAIGTSVHSGRRGDGGVTLDFRVDVLAGPAPEARVLRAAGGVLADGAAHGTARVDVTDDGGLPVAHAIGALAVTAAFPLPSETDGAPPDRPAIDPVALCRTFDGAEPDGAALFELALTPDLNNMRGIVHGGVLTATGLLAARRLSPGGAVLWFAAEFLRPVALRAGRLTYQVETTRAGARFRTMRTTVLLPDGRPAVFVTVMIALAPPGIDV